MSTDKTRVISANDLHVILTSFLNAAQEIQIAMCLFDDDHRAQEDLNRALGSVMAGADVCLHLHRSAKVHFQCPQETTDV